MRLFLFFCLSHFLLLASCSEEIDFSPYEQRKVVVNCLLTNEPKQKLTLTYSNKLNNFYFEKINDATVSLFCDDELAGYFSKDNYNDWYLDYLPIAGEKYRLTVEIDGEPFIEATTTMPYDADIVYDKENTPVEIPYIYYRKHFIQKRQDLPYWIFSMNKIHESDELTDKDILQNSIGTNHKDCDKFNLSDANMSSLQNEFTTLEHYCYLHILPNDEEEYRFFIEGYLGKSWIYFRAVSDEYDQYLKTSIAKMLVYQSFDDPSQWFDENTVYSNIVNGLGIFGAYSDLIFKMNDSSPDEPMVP